MEYLLTKHSLDNSGFLNTPFYTHKLNVNFNWSCIPLQWRVLG